METRPVTGTGSVKKLKRSDVIHFNSKTPLLTNPTNDSNELNRHSNKSHPYENQQERFQNLLTIVRPPYATNMSPIIPNDSTIPPTNNHNRPTENTRSTRSTSARGTLDFHLTPNTIYV